MTQDGYRALHATIASGRGRASCQGRRREDGEIGLAAGEAIEADLAVACGCKLAAQQIWRGAVPGRRTEGVDNADRRAGLEPRHEIVEQDGNDGLDGRRHKPRGGVSCWISQTLLSQHLRRGKQFHRSSARIVLLLCQIDFAEIRFAVASLR